MTNIFIEDFIKLYSEIKHHLKKDISFQAIESEKYTMQEKKIC